MEFMERDCDLYLDQLRDLLLTLTGVRYSLSTICRALQRAEMTLKLVRLTVVSRTHAPR
jgi:transposase